MSNPNLQQSVHVTRDRLDNSIVYVDLQCNTYTGNGSSPVGRQVTRTQPIIAKQSDYYCAVARANFPQSDIPMWAAELLIGQVNSPPLLTVYNVALTYDGVDSDAIPIQLIPTVQNAPPPAVPLVAQPSNSFAFIYDIETVVAMVNTALATAFSNLAGKTTLPLAACAPYWSFDGGSSLLSFNCYPYSVYDQGSDPYIGIYFSASFLPYLNCFSTTIVNDNAALSLSTGSRDVRINTAGLKNSFLDLTAPSTWVGPPGLPADPASPRDASTALMVIQAQFPPFGSFRCLQKIQILCSGLGAVLEGVDAPVAQLASAAQNLTSSVLADFTPDYTSVGSYQEPLIYTPSAIIPGARFIELTGDQPLIGFGITIVWTDALGNQHPVTVSSSQQTAGIKLVFVRREVVLGRQL